MTAGRTVLITGAGGAIGARMLQALGQRGWDRRCLIHRHPAAGAEQQVHGDITVPASLTDAVRGVSAIVHLAALTHSRSEARYEEVNTEGTRNLLSAAVAAGVERFLFISTRAISPDGGGYSASKHRAEEAVRGSGLKWTIVRLPEVYGAGSAEGVDKILAQVSSGSWVPMVGRGDQPLCPVHVDDVVSACVTALDAPCAIGHTYTLAGPPVTTVAFAEMAGDVLGRRPRMLRVPTVMVAALGALSRRLPLPLYPDQLARLRAPKPPLSTDAEADLAFRPRPLREGLTSIVSGLRE